MTSFSFAVGATRPDIDVTSTSVSSTICQIEDLVEALLAASNDPARFVELAFPEISPEQWRREVLACIANQLQENARLNRWKAVQIAVASGNGVGKTALLSWIILWALVTFEETLGVAQRRRSLAFPWSPDDSSRRNGCEPARWAYG